MDAKTRRQPPINRKRKMTESAEILLMNVHHYEALLRVAHDEDKRRQIEKLLAETRAELQLATDLLARQQ